MDYDSYGSNAVELAIDLANADRQDPSWAARFVRTHGEWFTTPRPAGLSAADAVRAAETADLVRAVALATTRDDVLARLNELLSRARPQPYATDHDGELHLHYAAPGTPAVEQLRRRSPWVWPRSSRSTAGSDWASAPRRAASTSTSTPRATPAAATAPTPAPAAPPSPPTAPAGKPDAGDPPTARRPGTSASVGSMRGRRLRMYDRQLHAWVGALPATPADRWLRRLSRAADHGKLWLGIAAVLALRPGRPRRAALHGIAALGSRAWS